MGKVTIFANMQVRWADLSGAYLRGAGLEHVHHLTQDQIKEAPLTAGMFAVGSKIPFRMERQPTDSDRIFTQGAFAVLGQGALN